MESNMRSTLLLALFLVPCSHAQGVTGTSSKTLEPWLVGLTAVTCFLFVVFTATLVNRFFCSNKKDTEEESESGIKMGTAANVYDNIAMEVNEESFKSAEPKVEDNKQTIM